jgi:predicted SAM-dependent methyltransferase
LGFKDLTGIEPYLTKTIEYNSNFKIQRTEIDSLDDSFDLIRLHHVFEHVSDPIKTLQSVYKNLSSSGTVVLTIPIADYVYNTYKENSYILQAPHHFHLFTLNGITRLTQSSGFKIQRVVRNARGISNWIYISELWNNNITKHTLNKYFPDENKLKSYLLNSNNLHNISYPCSVSLFGDSFCFCSISSR